MRWWLTTDSPRVFSVDNAAVKGMDFSTLESDIWMVQWTEGKGEIERQSASGENLNGLREPFIDVVPYAPLFQQFLRLLKAKALLLPQAKKVQSDLIREIFESKRQAPYHYPVAAGDYWWDAADETLYSSTASGLQNTIAKLNTVIDKLNALVANINSFDNGPNAVINQHATVGNELVRQTNAMIAEIGGNVVNETNYALDAIDGIFAQINANIVVAGQTLVPYLNNVIIGYRDYDHLDYNTINNRLRTDNFFGLTVDLPYTSATFSDINVTSSYRADYLTSLTPGTFSDATDAEIPWTNITHVAVANATWIPVGATAPVNVTPAEQAAIMSGIAARTADLNVKKNTKLGEVAALTTVDIVIDYNVTTGW